jgi:hypothetical protein
LQVRGARKRRCLSRAPLVLRREFVVLSVDPLTVIKRAVAPVHRGHASAFPATAIGKHFRQVILDLCQRLDGAREDPHVVEPAQIHQHDLVVSVHVELYEHGAMVLASLLGDRAV